MEMIYGATEKDRRIDMSLMEMMDDLGMEKERIFAMMRLLIPSKRKEEMLNWMKSRENDPPTEQEVLVMALKFSE
ncbi:MAG: hypothetical protein SPJ32_04680 [Oscillospiraceae bacterium]|nr:hypothetical protein [Oscillospiraceae bacterium]